MNNSLGRIFRLSSFGESHGDCIGVLIDGCPAGLKITVDDIQIEVDKRKASNRNLATSRHEDDRIEFFSGVFDGRTTGAPICLVIWNKNIDSSEYDRLKNTPRPGHADYPAFTKYGGYNDFRGGGRFSGRITAGFVMAGAIAKKLLETIGISILAHVNEIGGIRAKSENNIEIIKNNVVKNEVYCADLIAAEQMITAIKKAKLEGDSLGGVIESLALGVPPGLGEPVFGNLESELSRAYFAIPAVKGVEFGIGFAASRLRGSQNNDPFLLKDGKVITLSNNSGGILGGLSNGMPIIAHIAIKPTPSISLPQQTVNIIKQRNTRLKVRGRHDTCIVPRAVPVVEAMTAIVLCDMALQENMIPRVINESQRL
jgi:chorismate synthase